jgi:release factor glutamine methyltransferase
MSDGSLPANNSLSVGDWLRSATQQLTHSGIDTARLDSLVLLSDILGDDRSVVLAHLDRPLDPSDVCELNNAIQRRSSHVPLAYIRGKAAFYGREFAITPDVLVPRPESEAILELLLTHPALRSLRDHDELSIADVGTGSGALAITAKLSLPHAMVYATDIDPICLEVAERNAKAYDARVQFTQGNLVEPLGAELAKRGGWILLCNLPYVPVGFPINRAASHEPALALFAGHDGLDAYRELFGQIGILEQPPYALITESLPQQHHQLTEIASQYNYKVAATLGLAQLLTHTTD